MQQLEGLGEKWRDLSHGIARIAVNRSVQWCRLNDCEIRTWKTVVIGL